MAHDDPKKILRFYKVVPSLSLGHVPKSGFIWNGQKGEEKRRDESSGLRPFHIDVERVAPVDALLFANLHLLSVYLNTLCLYQMGCGCRPHNSVYYYEGRSSSVCGNSRTREWLTPLSDERKTSRHVFDTNET